MAAIDSAPAASSVPALAVEGLRKTFDARVAVDAVDLEVPRGAFFGLVGPNGAGKTTLLRMAVGLLRPDSGRVAVEGHDVWGDPVRAKAAIGVVEDTPRLFDRLTGRELLEFHGLLRGMRPDVVTDRSRELLRVLTLTDDADKLVVDYSLGMTKKIALAAALLHGPRLIVLDEPFGAIDPLSTNVIEQLLRRHVEQGGTIVFSSHVMDVVERLCDHVAVIAGGRILAAGRTDEVAAGGSLREAFFRLVGAPEVETGELGWLGSSSG